MSHWGVSDCSQVELEKIAQQYSVNTALDALYQWSLQSGYITHAKLQDNPRYEYWDERLGIYFKTQINIARSRYTPAPLLGAHLPLLHCSICPENRLLPGKENLRIFELALSPQRPFFLQLTPFPLFPYHFVLIARDKTPMRMDQQSIEDLYRFITLAPGYVGCSNSDVEWAGASILAHHHYQVIRDLHLPIMDAARIPEYQRRTERSGALIEYGLLAFPIACCKLVSRSAEAIITLGGNIIMQWKQQDPGRNTCNLILRKEQPFYQLYIIFRNPNYRTPPELTSIKSEGVGIIEVAGEGIYPVPETAELQHRIQYQGLEVIKGIIEGNNPVPRQQFGQLMALLDD